MITNNKNFTVSFAYVYWQLLELFALIINNPVFVIILLVGIIIGISVGNVVATELLQDINSSDLPRNLRKSKDSIQELIDHKPVINKPIHDEIPIEHLPVHQSVLKEIPKLTLMRLLKGKLSMLQFITENQLSIYPRIQVLTH